MSKGRASNKNIDDYFLTKVYNQIFPKQSSQKDREQFELSTDELNKYHLFKITEFNINHEVKEIDQFINERYQTVLSACYFSNISVATIFSSNNGKTDIYIGLKKEGDFNKNDRGNCETLIAGILPCNQYDFNEEKLFRNLTRNSEFGGIISGIPVMIDKKSKEKQQFKITSLIRSLKNTNFTFAIISKPIKTQEIDDLRYKLFSVKDVAQILAKTNINKSESLTLNDNPHFVKTLQNTFMGTEKSSDKGVSESIDWLRNEFSISDTDGYYDNSKPKNTLGKPSSTQYSEAKTTEKINSRVTKFIEGLDLLIERFSKGINNGFWETNISFVTVDKSSSELIVASFLGELANDSDTISPYVKFVIKEKELPTGMFFPLPDDKRELFDKSLSSYLTSKELSFIASPPKEAIPGYEIKRRPNLALTDINFGETNTVSGYITENGIVSSNNTFSLSNETLNKHVFITGITGSGKSNSVKQILKSTGQIVPFLVIESAKRDYRQLSEDPMIKNLMVYTIGDTLTSPIKINPFYVQKGVKLSSHIDFLKAIFNASFSLYGPMPAILERCLNTIYEKLGWDLITGEHYSCWKLEKGFNADFYESSNHHYFFPTLNTLKNEIDRYINQELDYQGEYKENIKTALLVRIDSLTTGAKGLMFNTYDFHSIEDLLKYPTIFEMEDLVDDDDKAFFVGLLITLISEYRQKENPVINPISKNKGLQHILVIEEAHRLLKNISTEKSSELMGNPKGKAVELFGNVLAEMRSMGQGVIIAEQIPSKLAPEVIKNSNTKIIHRLVAKDDQSLLAGSLSISDQEALYLNRLKTGHALCHKEGMEKPVEVKFSTGATQISVSNEQIRKKMEVYAIPSLHSNRAFQLQGILKDDGIRILTKFLNSLGISGEDYLNELLEELLKELKNIIGEKETYNFFEDEDLYDFATLQIIELFRDGIFGNKGLLPQNIRNYIRTLFKSKDSISYDQLMAELENYYHKKFEKICWGLVEKMVIEYFTQNTYVEPNEENIVFALNDFLLIEDIGVKKLILNNTKGKLWNQSVPLLQPQSKLQPRNSVKEQFKKWLKIA